MNVRTVLVAARKLLVDGGWCQKRSMATIDGVVCRCAGSAISDACPVGPWRMPMLMATQEHFRDFITTPEGRRRIYEWNDEDGRTKDEVVAKFDEAIAVLPEEPREDAVVCT